MSAGKFVRSQYKSGAGLYHPIRIQPETLALVVGGETNAEPTGATPATKSKISAKVSGSRKSIGLHARRVRIQFGDVAADVPSGYKPGSTTTLPILDPDVYDALTGTESGTYLGKPVVVTSLIDEAVK